MADRIPFAEPSAALPVGPENIGRRSSCPFCSRAAVVDDVHPELGVVLRHDATTWCVVGSVTARGLAWSSFFSPPFDTTKMRAQVAEDAARKEARRGR